MFRESVRGAKIPGSLSQDVDFFNYIGPDIQLKT
jgi:hypothetical protein